jgi:two-component system, OmpR family, response regulator
VHVTSPQEKLTEAQKRVLAALVRRNGRLATRRELYEEAFGRPLVEGSRAIDQHIAKIRAVLGSSDGCIVTIGRVGYRLDSSACSETNP